MKARLLAIILAVSACLPLRAQFNEKAVADYYLQYVPVVADLGLGIAGVKSENPTLDRFIAAGIGYVSEAVIVNGLKYTIREERPDGSARNSFPSGHTATAFLGAELVRHEYGWGWGAGAYAVATGVAVLRVYHHRHYWWDTLAGAGCGILSANIGYWLLNPARRLFGMEIPENVDMSFTPVYDPLSGTVGTALALRF